MRRRHRRALEKVVVGRGPRKVPHRGIDPIGRIAKPEVPPRSSDADLRTEVGVHGGSPIGADRGDAQDFPVRGRIVRRRSSVVSRCRHDEGARVCGADDRAVQRRVVEVASETHIDDPGPGGRLHRTPRPIVRRQTRRIENALRDVVQGSESGGAEDANRTDSHAPIHSGHPDAVVADCADRARDVQAVGPERVGREARPRAVERV